MKYLDETVQYANDCITGKIISCKRHIAVCKRFIKIIDKIKNNEINFYWNEEWAERIIKFCNFMTYKDGIVANKKVTLMNFQRFIIFNIFCIRNKDTNKRMYNKVYIQISRKNAKTQLLAIILLIKLGLESSYYNEKSNCQCCGNGEKKSLDIINECKSLMEGGLLEKYNKFTIRANYIKHNKTKSILEALNKSSMHKDGAKLSMILIDEFHEYDDKMAEVLNRKLGLCSKDDLLAVITTAGVNLTYKCYNLYTKFTNMLDNVLEYDEEQFIDIYELDKEDIADIYNINTNMFIKSNPMRFGFDLGKHKILSEYKSAQIDHGEMPEFLAKTAGMWSTNTNTQFIDFNKYKECIIKKNEEQKYIDIIKNSGDLYVGLDLSRKHDLTSFSLVVPFINSTHEVEFIVDTHSFLPNEIDLKNKSNKDKIDYIRYVLNNELTVFNEEEINQQKIYEFILTFLESKYNNKNIKLFCYDPAFAQYLATVISTDYDVFALSQNHNKLNEPTLSLKENINLKKIHFFKNGLMDLCIQNAVVTKYMNKIKIDKNASRFKIDCLDATINAYESALYNSAKMIKEQAKEKEINELAKSILDNINN